MHDPCLVLKGSLVSKEVNGYLAGLKTDSWRHASVPLEVLPVGAAAGLCASGVVVKQAAPPGSSNS